MGRWGTIIAGALVLAAAPAAAQERPIAEEVASTTAELVDRLETLREAMGVDAPLFPPETLTTALMGAIPVLPDGDDRPWSSSVGFDFRTDRATNGLEPDAEGRRVFIDARSCLSEGERGDIVHFERFARADVRGHRCVVLIPGDEADIWLLAARTFAEGPTRRLEADYALATVVEGQGAVARGLLEDRLDQNVALAGLLADYALEMFLVKEASSDPLTMDNFAERHARLQARLAAIAEEVQAAGEVGQ